MYIVAFGPLKKGSAPGYELRCCIFFISSEVYSGLIFIPSGVSIKIPSISCFLSSLRAFLFQFSKLEFSSFVSDSTLQTKQLEPQKLIRKVSTPVDDENQFQTLPGATGILVNGVELLNYKSGNNIFYGADDKRQIDQSVSLGTNLGYQFWKNEEGKLSTEIGLAWINDKLFSSIDDERIALVCTNQIRDKIGFGGFGDPTVTSHGKAMSFYASLRIKLSRT